MSKRPECIPASARRIQVRQHRLSIEGLIEYRSKTQGYRRDETVIAAVVDRDGREIELAWESHWREIAPGIEARGPRQSSKAGPVETVLTQQLRIRSAACPVYVLFVRHASVVPYGRSTDFGDTSSQWWVCYD
ncbi:MAG: hypothetical protein QY320_00240 [Gammaproteobacteria bacterium]|nr:MAG: hypothetical protein QY320_00240 [Gammaproteobacteria bacterium]